MNEFVVDCNRCVARGAGCSDCVMSHLLGEVPGRLFLREPDLRAVEVLAEAGLVPPLRLDLGNTLKVV